MIYDLLGGVKDVPLEIQDTLEDSVVVLNLLSLLEKHLNDVKDVTPKIEAGLRLPLENATTALEKLAETIEPFVASKVLKWDSLKWAMKQKEIDGLKRKLKDSQTTLAMVSTFVLNNEIEGINLSTKPRTYLDAVWFQSGKTSDNRVIAFNARRIRMYAEAERPSAATMQGINSLLSDGPGRVVWNDEGQSAMHLAAQESYYLTDQVLKLDRVNEPNVEGETPLMSAVIAGNLDAARYRIQLGADVNATSDHERTPLHYAAIYNMDVDIIQLLTKCSANVHLVDASGQTPLFAAARHGNATCCKCLMENRATARSTEKFGPTALHFLAMRGKSAFMRRLLSSTGPDVEAFYDRKIELDQPSAKDKIGLMDLFLNDGADINAESNGYTALHLAALTGQDHLVSALLERGAKAHGVNLSCLNWGLSPENLDKLLHGGADIEASDSRWNKTPLSWASETGSAEAVRILLDHGAKVNTQDVQGISPLRYAANNARTETVRLLLNNGADPSLPDNFGKTPLMETASGRPFLLGGRSYNPTPADREETTVLLLDAGADPSARQTSGGAAIHYAIRNGYYGVLKLLYSKGGCDLTADWNGKTPLKLAEELDQGRMVKWLKTQLWTMGKFESKASEKLA